MRFESNIHRGFFRLTLVLSIFVFAFIFFVVFLGTGSKCHPWVYPILRHIFSPFLPSSTEYYTGVYPYLKGLWFGLAFAGGVWIIYFSVIFIIAGFKRKK